MSKKLELFDQLIARGTSDPFHFYARAMELRSLARRDEALTSFAELTERFPEYVPTYLMAAQLALELGEPERARGFASAGVAAARRAGNDHALSELTSFLDGL
jgi:hypothetical protein